MSQTKHKKTRRVKLVIHINFQTCYEIKIVKTPYERTLWIPYSCGHYDIYVKRPRKDHYITMINEDWDKLGKVFELLKDYEYERVPICDAPNVYVYERIYRIPRELVEEIKKIYTN